MKITQIVAVSLLLGLVLGCETHRVKSEEIIAQHPQWDEQTVAHIRQGMLLEGMNKEQVRAAWGEHCQTCPGTRKYEWGETWEYQTQVVFFDKTGKVTKFEKK